MHKFLITLAAAAATTAGIAAGRSLAMFVTAGVYQVGPSGSCVQVTGK